MKGGATGAHFHADVRSFRLTNRDQIQHGNPCGEGRFYGVRCPNPTCKGQDLSAVEFLKNSSTHAIQSDIEPQHLAR